MKESDRTWTIVIDGDSYTEDALKAAEKFLATLLRMGCGVSGQFHDFSGPEDTVTVLKAK